MTGQLTLLHLDAIERQCVLVQKDGGTTGNVADAWLLTAMVRAARQYLRDEIKRTAPGRKR
jgi:hypothetical protein